MGIRDRRHADQQVRGAVVLPNGTGKKVTVLAICKGDKANEATEAGAEYVGAEDMIAKIQGGWFDFDVVVATPDMMGMVGRLGRVLGPKGLMPNPKSGTVSMDIAKAVRDIKAGKVEYRVDKTAIIHCPVGKASFEEGKLTENLRALMEAIIKAKPAAAKGTYIRSAVPVSYTHLDVYKRQGRTSADPPAAPATSAPRRCARTGRGSRRRSPLSSCRCGFRRSCRCRRTRRRR